MRFIMPIIWALLIGTAVSYVLSSMGGEPFVIVDTLILAAFFAIAVIIIGVGILGDPEKDQ